MSGSVAYTYDDAGRLIEADYGNGKVFSYTYDDAGNLIDRTVSGGLPLPIPPTMTTGKSGSLLDLRYSVASCNATDHAVFFGGLGNFSMVTSASCSISNTGSASIIAPPGSVWFLIAGVESSVYSSVGSATAGERSLSRVSASCPPILTQDTSLTCP